MLFQCEGCHLDFETNGSLLKHISHREPCLIHYGQDRFDLMKCNARLSSKRKWKKANSAKSKMEYENNKFDPKNPDKRKKTEDNAHTYTYVPVAVRDTFDGEVFLKVFNFIFQNKKQNVIDNYTKSLQDKFKDGVIDEALDLTFNDHEKLESKFRFENPQYFLDYDSEQTIEDLIENNLEKTLEMRFDSEFKSLMNFKVSKLTDRLKVLITQNCFKQAEQHSLKRYLGKFRVTTYKQIEDEAMDFVFNTGIDELEDHKIEGTWNTSNRNASFDEKIEWFLEKKMSEALEKLVFASYESEVTTALETKIEAKMLDVLDYVERHQ